MPHLFHSLMHGRDDRGHQGLGHVADAQPDDLPFRVRLLVSLHPPGYLREQVGAGQLLKILIDAQQNSILLYLLQSGHMPSKTKAAGPV